MSQDMDDHRRMPPEVLGRGILEDSVQEIRGVGIGVHCALAASHGLAAGALHPIYHL
jgi:hypothetical protein